MFYLFLFANKINKYEKIREKMMKTSEQYLTLVDFSNRALMKLMHLKWCNLFVFKKEMEHIHKNIVHIQKYSWKQKQNKNKKHQKGFYSSIKETNPICILGYTFNFQNFFAAAIIIHPVFRKIKKMKQIKKNFEFNLLFNVKLFN